jgi:3-hydroxyacyl-CoA dehydrogenase
MASSKLTMWTGRVAKWVADVLGSEALFDRRERAMRLIEEAIELGQVEGLTQADVDRITRYVMGRPVGVAHQEVGGVMVCVLAYCCSAGLDANEVTEQEVSRIERIDPRIVQTKHAAKAHAKVAVK